MNNILIKNFTKQYPNEDKPILKNINLQFIEGKIYSIIGKSGCGKTTLLKAIANLDNDYEGEILFNGTNLKEISNFDNRSLMANYITYIQQESSLFKNLNARDNVNCVNLFNNHLTNLNLSIFNLEIEENKLIKNYSGGEQKRISLFQSIEKESKIILLDEPTSNLDYKNSEIIMDYFKSLSKDKIIIFVTHNIELAKKYSDEILKIENNKIIKNYKKKVKDSKLDINTSFKIHNNKANKASLKFFKSETKTNRMLIASSIICFLTLGLSLSISLGIKNFFNKQIEDTNKSSYILIEQHNPLISINEDDLNYFRNNYDDNFYFIYDCKNEIICTLNDEEIYIPNELYNYPFEYCEELKEDEIILTINSEYKNYLETLLNTDDIEDYLESNDLFIDLNFIDTLKSYKLIDLFFDDSVMIKFNLKNNYEYINMHKETDKKYLVCNKEISENLDTFFNSSLNYKISSLDNFYIIEKYNNSIISFNSLSQKINSLFPIFEYNNSSWINYYNGLLYFNNTIFSLNKDNSNINETIYFSPYLEDIEMGRYYEDETEIMVSSNLFNKYNLKIGDYINIEFNNVNNNFKIIGVINDDANYIYQSSNWAYQYFINAYNIKPYLLKTNCYLAILDPNKIENTINELTQSFPNCNISSPIKDVTDSISQISKIIIYISLSVTLILFIVSLFSIIILSKIEKYNYSKNIDFLKSIGLQNDDLNRIYFRINIERFILSSLISSILIYVIIGIIKLVLKQSNLFNGRLLSNNILIFVIILIISIVYYLLNYLINKFRKKKTSNLIEVKV